MATKWHQSLQFKSIVFVSSLVLLSSILIGGFSFIRFRQAERQMVVERLVTKARLLSSKLASSHDNFSDIIRVLSLNPSLDDFVRANQQAASNPNALGTARNRLETGFEKLMAKYSYLTQVRFIQADTLGTEMVRVDRSSQDILVVPRGDLQSKAKEPYFSGLMSLKENEVFFSDITLNREHGKVVEPKVLTLRIGYPLMSIGKDRDQVFGFLLINVDYVEYLQSVLSELVTDEKVFVLDSAGDYISFSGQDVTASKIIGKQESPKLLGDMLSFQDGQRFLEVDDTIAAAFFTTHVGNHAPLYLDVVLSEPKAKVFARSSESRNSDIALIGGLSMISLLSSLYVSRRILRPLVMTTHDLSQIESPNHDLHNLPSKRKDEIGELSRTFINLHHRLQEANRRLEQKSQKQFLAKVSHELRSPLNSLILTLEYLTQDQEGNLSKGQLDNLKIARQSADDIHFLINDLLDHESMEKGLLKLEFSKFSLNQMARRLTNLFNVQFDKKKIHFEIRSNQGEFCSDQYRIEQILRNLISNALKFTPKEGYVRVDIDLSKETETTRWLNIKVQDSGVGIKEEHLNRIFERFVQIDPMLHQQHQGTGLGLTISRHIAELLSGHLEVDSVYGKGSTFTLRLPELNPQIPKIREIAGTERPGSSETELTTDRLRLLEGKKILVVDDDIRNIFALRQVFHSHHLEVAQANNGEEALEVCKKESESFDLALIDIMMPGIDGFELSKAIHGIKTYQSLTCIAMSGHLETSDEEFKKSDFRAFIPKPIDTNQLLTVMINHLN